MLDSDNYNAEYLYSAVKKKDLYSFEEQENEEDSDVEVNKNTNLNNKNI